MQNLVAVSLWSYRVGACRRSQKVWDAITRCHGIGIVPELVETRPPHTCYMFYAKRDEHNYGDGDLSKKLNRRVPPFKVAQGRR